MVNRIRKLRKIRLHREGTNELLYSLIAIVLIGILLWRSFDSPIPFILFILLFGAVWLLALNFYRCPIRYFNGDTEGVVVAPADGKVVDVLRQSKGLGNLVVIDHGDGLRTVYAHLSDIYVAINQKVSRGKVIGKVGSSGASFTASLHYEVRKEGRAMDPVNYFFASLSPSAYGEMLLVANTTGQSLD